MPSLYLHVPFCAKKCRYCDFYSVTVDDRRIEAFFLGLRAEMDVLRREGVVPEGAAVETIYIGGGTPSVLSDKQLRSLCSIVTESFDCSALSEWTVECNPESYSPEKAECLASAGVTRISLGIQSLDDRELRFLGRIHTADRCLRVLSDPSLESFSSVGVDLMHGLPRHCLSRQVSGGVDSSIHALAALPIVRHISLYELTVADSTPFGRHRKLLSLPDDDTAADETRKTWDSLCEAGFEQYEVSNFSHAGHRCLHNERYWDHGEYIGLGPAAHSFVKGRRWGNVRDLDRYAAMSGAGTPPREFLETLDAGRFALEMLFLGLRREAGIDEERFARETGMVFTEFLRWRRLAAFVGSGLIVYEKPFWRPTTDGLMVADAMARELAP